MVADSPVRYADALGFDFVAHTPAAWDETRVLAGDVGRYIVVARRRGSDWWVGAITDAQARTLVVPLGMLAPGTWRLDGFADVGETRRARRETRTVAAGAPLALLLGTAGGYAAHLSRIGG